MFKATAHLQSIAPYSQSRMHNTPKLEKEGHDDYERRTWREKCTFNNEGDIFIPPMAFKLSISDAPKFSGGKIPGRGAATWTKHFMAGVLSMEPTYVGAKKADVAGEWYWVNADGKRGSGTRVWRCFPVVPEWNAAVTFMVLDHAITEKVFRHHLTEAGRFIGIGRFRPQNTGFYGRFKIDQLDWEDWQGD